jgi:hypothetical protein
MKVELINQHGRAMLARPVYLKPTAPARLVLEIDDEYVTHSSDWYEDEFAGPEQVRSQTKTRVPDATNSPVQRRFNAILGPLAMERPSASIGDDHQMLLEALEEKYSGR